jgi:phage terminase large subunit-like protein
LDFPTSVKVVEKKFFEWCPRECIQKWNEKHRILTMKSGSTVQFKSQDSGVEKFQGERIRWCWGDEELRKDIFEEIDARQMADQDLDVWMTLTPLKGLTWIISEVLEPWQEYQRTLKMSETACLGASMA